jgi:hypothetical protein
MPEPVTDLSPARRMLLGIKRRAEGPRSSLRRHLDDDTERLPRGASRPEPPVLESDLDPLPGPAQRYLRWMGVLGRPRVAAFRARFRGELRMRPDQAWMPYDAWQYNRADPLARLVRMRVNFAHVLPMYGTDTYIEGAGHMRGRLLGLIPVADGRGPEFDLSELVTYVNDAMMLAPSMLLTSATSWHPVDDTTFEVVHTDGANRVAARGVVDETGRLLSFDTDDRWYAGTKPPTRTTWSTPFEQWTTTPDGHRIPAAASAVWHLPEGAFTYVRGAFDPASTTFETIASAS